MDPTPVDQRVLMGVPAVLTSTRLDSNGDPVDPQSAVTVSVADATGADLYSTSTGVTVGGGGSGVASVPVPAGVTARLAILTATWTETGAGVTWTSTHEVCGGFFFSLADARASDSSLADTGRYPDSAVLAKRKEVEEEAEWICDVAFVPRYRRVTVDGSGTNELLLPDNALRRIRSATIYSTIGTSPMYTTLTPDDLAALDLREDVLVTRTNYKIWDIGQGNITVEYEHGFGSPRSDMKDAALLRLRSRLNLRKTGVPDRATSFTSAEGGTYRLDLPGVYKTGIPEVDSTYARNSKRSRNDDGPVPASRTLRVDPNRYSMFHGGRH